MYILYLNTGISIQVPHPPSYKSRFSLYMIKTTMCILINHPKKSRIIYPLYKEQMHTINSDPILQAIYSSEENVQPLVYKRKLFEVWGTVGLNVGMRGFDGIQARERFVDSADDGELAHVYFEPVRTK